MEAKDRTQSILGNSGSRLLLKEYCSKSMAFGIISTFVKPAYSNSVFKYEEGAQLTQLFLNKKREVFELLVKRLGKSPP